MNCVIKIGDREAVPVRAIPFVTGWSISPDVVARGLAGLDFNRRLKSLRAYHLDLDGNFSPMLSKEWDVVHDGLRALSASLRAGETAGGSSYPDWVRQSIPALPSHCFVWLDEFEPAARHAMNALMSLDEERDDENELNFSPRIPPGLVDAVFEGLLGAGAVLPPDQDHAGSADSPASASKSRPGRKPSKAPVVLEKILDALEDYASATGQDFDRHAMPGPLGESYEDEGGFHWLCATLYPGIFRRAKDTFAKHRACICALESYAKPTDFYRLALPHIAPTLGVTPNVRHMPKGGRKIS